MNLNPYNMHLLAHENVMSNIIDSMFFGNDHMHAYNKDLRKYKKKTTITTFQN